MPETEDEDVNRGLQLAALVLTQCAVASIILWLRIYSRLIIRQLGWDDWLMVTTLFLYISCTAILVAVAIFGGCRHLHYLNNTQKTTSLMLYWIVQPFATMSFATSKASVGVMLIRILGNKSKSKRVWFLWALIALSALINTAGSIIPFLQCDQVSSLWTQNLADECWHPKVQVHYSIFVGSWNAFCDLCLALLPITIIWPLQLSTRDRVGLCILLGLGVFACVVACAKTSTLPMLEDRSDLTWVTFEPWVWTATETFLLIVCGSIPCIRPLYDRLKGREVGPRQFTNPNATHTRSISNCGSQALSRASLAGSTRRLMDSRRYSDMELEDGWGGRCVRNGSGGSGSDTATRYEKPGHYLPQIQEDLK